MTDYQLMSNLFNTKVYDDINFKDVQPQSLPDSNKTSYGSGQLNFDTKSMSSLQYWVPAMTDLLLPFTINVSGVLSASNCLGIVTGSAGSAGPATVDSTGNGGTSNSGGILSVGANCSIAPKLSSLSLIQGVDTNLQTGGTGIISDIKCLSLINSIKMLVENNKDWEATNAAQFCLAKNNLATLPNAGFNKRQNFMYNLSNCTYYFPPTLSSGDAYISKIECVLEIPLRYIHNFFANLDYPIRGVPFFINFHMCREFNPNSQYYGFDVVGTPAPTIKYTLGQASVSETNYTSSMLKYSSYTFPPSVGVKVDQDMLNGKLSTRVMKFASTQVYDDQSNKVGDLTSYQIATGVVKPIRLWLIGTAVNALKSQNEPFVTSLSLKNLNLRINSDNRFTNSLATPYDMYQQVKNQMPELATSNEKGSLVDYRDFNITNYTQFLYGSDEVQDSGLYALYCIQYNQQGRTSDEAVQLVLDSIRTNATSSIPLDFIVLVEREVTAVMKYNKNEVEIQVGSTL